MLWALPFSQLVSNLSCNGDNLETVPVVMLYLMGSLSPPLPHQT